MRYLLIEFDDNTSADRLRAQIDAASAAGKGMRVAGLFGVPTVWCECPKLGGYHNHEVVRGGKMGWWVHRACRKARVGTHQLENLIKPKERRYGKKTGMIQVVTSVSIGEVPVQNLEQGH